MASIKKPQSKTQTDRFGAAEDSSQYDMGRNVKRDDYPVGLTEYSDDQENERHFKTKSRAYDRSADDAREHDDDNPVIAQDPDKFYAKEVADEEQGDDQRYFGGDMGYYERKSFVDKSTDKAKK